MVLSVLRRYATQQKRAGKMELLGLHLARPWYVRLRLLMWWNYPNTNGARFVSVEFMEMRGAVDPLGRPQRQISWCGASEGR